MSLTRAARPALTAADADGYRRDTVRGIRLLRYLARRGWSAYVGWWPITIPVTVALVALVLMPGWIGWLLLVLAAALGILLVRTSMADALRLRTTHAYRRWIEGDEAHVGLAVGWGLVSTPLRDVARVVLVDAVDSGVIDITLQIPQGVGVESFDPILAARDLGGRHGHLRVEPDGQPDEIVLMVIAEDATLADHQANFLDTHQEELLEADPFGRLDDLGTPETSLHEGGAWWETTADDAPAHPDSSEER